MSDIETILAEMVEENRLSGTGLLRTCPGFSLSPWGVRMMNSKESPEICSDSTETVQTEVVDYLKKRGRQKLWAGSIAANKLQDEADRQRISQAHEARLHGRLWGGTSHQSRGQRVVIWSGKHSSET
jgi:hypothetical protein